MGISNKKSLSERKGFWRNESTYFLFDKLFFVGNTSFSFWDAPAQYFSSFSEMIFQF